MSRNRRTLLTLTLLALGSWNTTQAQPTSPVILEVDVENYVSYIEDTTDVTRYATLPNVTQVVVPKNFYNNIIIGDIVAVNGQPVKGAATFQNRRLGLTATPNAGDAIADTGRANIAIAAFEFQKSDGTAVGTLMTVGLAGAGTPPPGAPLAQTQGNNAIVGGTGAFLGVHGMQGQTPTPQAIAARQASITEDPANRRLNGGGRVRFMLTIFPAALPQVVTTSTGPAIAHADFSPVTAANPAKSGEVLIVKATGLGPTAPGVNPGQPFPSDASLAVNSPLQVSVNGQPAQVINAIGWPGLLDTYRVDIRVPDGTASATAAVQLTAAWISGAPVTIPIQ